MLPYELLSSHVSIDKKIIENKIDIDSAILPSHNKKKENGEEVWCQESQL